MNALQVFNTSTDTVTRDYNSGATATRLLRQKEYGEAHGLKGAELKRQFRSYLRENGIRANQALSVALTGGQILTTGIRWNAKRDGGSIPFIVAAKAEDKARTVPSEALREAEDRASKAEQEKAALAARLEELTQLLAGLGGSSVKAA